MLTLLLLLLVLLIAFVAALFMFGGKVTLDSPLSREGARTYLILWGRGVQVGGQAEGNQVVFDLGGDTPHLFTVKRRFLMLGIQRTPGVVLTVDGITASDWTSLSRGSKDVIAHIEGQPHKRYRVEVSLGQRREETVEERW
jgi:hypothetical protein